ncbi:MAG: 2-C-methyl-D-erythritol 4-phosphate cytidylyltransferase [Lachnospiraceae bacterium]|nr:2-C-methyl-D-erythritol 4-phosphate cytidylyltransferase [Lachnospiraceae bacterium]
MAIAIVLAGGSGSRMNSDVAKQFLMLQGKEILYYSLKTFQENENISDIILVARTEDMEYCKSNIVEKYGFHKVKRICAGGKERYNSVYNGLCLVEELSKDIKNEVVMIHDGARPFVTNSMIDESIGNMKFGSACTVGVPVKDTIKIVFEIYGEIYSKETPDRNTLYQIQTPQTFRYELIRSGYERMFQDTKYNITDDTMIVEQYMGMGCKIIMGSYENIKITTPEDLEFAEKIVEKNLENF